MIFTPGAPCRRLYSLRSTSRITRCTSAASKPAAGTVSLPGTISEVIYLGTSTRILVELEGGKRLTVLEQNASSRSTLDRRGESVHARFATADLVTLEPVAA